MLMQKLLGAVMLPNAPIEFKLAATYGSSTVSSSYSYNITYGLPTSPKRTIVVGIANGSNGGITVSSVTVGGVSASRLLAPIYNPSVADVYSSIEWWAAVVPGGTTGTVSYSMANGSVSRTGSVAFSVIPSSSSLVLLDSAQGTSSTTTLSADTAKNGLCLAMSYASSPSNEIIWGGLTKESYFQIVTSGRFIGVASHLSTSQETPRTMSATFSGGTFNVVQLISLE